MTAVNVARALPELASRQPNRLAIACPIVHKPRQPLAYQIWNYRQLDEASNRRARALEAIGVGRGVRAMLMVPPSLEFFALVFALFKVGAVPVMVDPGMGMANLGKCLAEAAPAAFIGVRKAHLARLVLGWAKRTVHTVVWVGGKPWGMPGHSLVDLVAPIVDPAYEPAATTADETAAILFTSGSTGVPKGAVYHHGAFAAQVEALKATYGIDPGEIDLPTFPLFALFAPALGMSSIVPLMDFTRPARVHPPTLIEAIETFGVTNMFGSPALLDRVGRYGEKHGVKLPTLRRVISAGAPVPATVLRRFAKMLSEPAEIVTPYGATEALPVCSIGSREILGETAARTDAGQGVCVGMPNPTLEARVIRISDGAIATWSDDLVLPVGEVGEIAVRGPVVTREYFGRPDLTALAKINDPARQAVWHRMGDVGWIDERGRLWYFGRKSHRVVLGDRTLFTEPCEAIFNAHADVYRTALVGVRKNGVVEPVLCAELEADRAGGADRSRISRELLDLGARHDHTRAIRRVLFHPAFPVDIRHNAKIFREKLAVWAERQDA